MCGAWKLRGWSIFWPAATWTTTRACSTSSVSWARAAFWTRWPFQGGRVVLVAVGKAAWSMARAACDCVGGRLDGGIVITKHGHAQGPIGSLLIREAGHPVPDQDTFSATEEALALTDGLTAEDTVLFLLSGGGSALFEAPLVPQEELQSITQSLLASGADIVEMNTIRSSALME